jgi:hypothetical protein
MPKTPETENLIHNLERLESASRERGFYGPDGTSFVKMLPGIRRQVLQNVVDVVKAFGGKIPE